MTDLGFSVQIQRDLLSLTPLEINDHINFYIGGSQFMGGQMSWTRQQVTSPFIDGSVTTSRNRALVTESISVEVLGHTQTIMETNVVAVIEAFSQDSFIMNVVYNGSLKSYVCEASDFTIMQTGPRWVSKQLSIQFQVPRQPVALTGGF